MIMRIWHDGDDGDMCVIIRYWNKKVEPEKDAENQFQKIDFLYLSLDGLSQTVAAGRFDPHLLGS